MTLEKLVMDIISNGGIMSVEHFNIAFRLLKAGRTVEVTGNVDRQEETEKP